MDCSYANLRATEPRREGTFYLTINRKTTNWIGSILCGNNLLKYVIGGNTRIEGRAGEMRRQGRRRRQLLDGLIEMRRYLKLKVGALDHTV
jgi:hypothetical protein